MPSPNRTEHLRGQDRRPPLDPIAIRVPDACRYVGIGRSTLYVLISKGEVEVIKLGSSTLVLTASLRRLIDARRESRGEQAESEV